MPRLLFRPAALTRDYLAGKRASQVPPLRIFFIVLLLLFLVGESVAGFDRVGVIKVDANDIKGLDELKISLYKPWDDQLTAWTRSHLSLAVSHPDQLVAAMGAWAHDFAFMTLPIFGLILAGIFVFRRGFVLFDHMVFSMHSLSVMGVILTFALVLNHVWGDRGMALLWLVPVHQFFHMRGVYGTGVVGTVARIGVLATVSTLAFILMLFGLVVLGLAALRG